MLCLATNSTTGERFSDVLDRAFTEAAIGFFHDAKPVDVQVGDPEFLYGQTWASVLGFTSSDVRGSLVVNLSLGALAAVLVLLSSVGVGLALEGEPTATVRVGPSMRRPALDLPDEVRGQLRLRQWDRAAASRWRR